MIKCKILLLLSMLLTSFFTVAGEAHVHGVATLQLALDDSLLHLNLSSPLDSLLGFEHLPRTEKQKAAVRHMADQLRQAERLFQPTLAARCTLKTYSLESPVLETGKHKGHDQKGHDHEGDNHEGHDHTDLNAEFVFYCAKPNELRDLEINLFSYFPGLLRLKTEAATPRGQSAAILTPSKRRITW
ncbi:MAG: DUF2796 domain-containing protein [Candidatus Nitrotoga sp.]|jgi:hypothetical protein